MKTQFLVLLFLILSACSSPSKNESFESYKKNFAATSVTSAEEVAWKKFESKVRRNPTSILAQDLNYKLKDLNKIRPGKFEIYVFPKISTKHMKSTEFSDVLIGKPQVFDVSLLAYSACQKFIESDLFKKYHAQSFFRAEELNDDQGCAIVEITSRSLKKLNRSLISKGDILTYRLFLNDSYQVHGYEIDSFIDGQNLSVTSVKTDPKDPISSGLSLFPVDLPQAFVSEKLNQSKIQDLSIKWIDNIAINQIKRKLNSKFKIQDCKATLFEYEDYYGNTSKVAWCQGLPWPSYSENDRFVSITQPLLVR